MSYIYKKSEPGLWTVGTSDCGTWEPDSDHDSEKSAADRVAYLNGGGIVEAILEQPSLRDFFAAKALQGIVSTDNTATRTGEKDVYAVQAAEAAYRYADAMLKARES